MPEVPAQARKEREQIVKVTDENTGYILNEIKDAKKETIERTKEVFEAHEQLDRERFADLQRELRDGRLIIHSKLDAIDGATKLIDGRVTGIERERHEEQGIRKAREEQTEGRRWLFPIILTVCLVIVGTLDAVARLS